MIGVNRVTELIIQIHRNGVFLLGSNAVVNSNGFVILLPHSRIVTVAVLKFCNNIKPLGCRTLGEFICHINSHQRVDGSRHNCHGHITVITHTNAIGRSNSVNDGDRSGAVIHDKSANTSLIDSSGKSCHVRI